MDLSTHLMAFTDVLQQLYEPIVERTGLSRLRFVILHLSAEKQLTLTDLTRRLDMPKSNLTYHVDWLEENGYVERRPSVDDRRVTYLYVTPKGQEIVQLVPQLIKQRVERFAARVTPEELAQMDAGLQLMVQRAPLLLAED